MTPQAWGVSTQTADAVYLHVLDAKAAAQDGWLTLTGTSDLKGQDVSRFADDRPLSWRRNSAGELEVQRDWGDDMIDAVLCVKK